MNHEQIIADIRTRAALNKSAAVGIVGSFSKSTKVNEGGGNREIVSLINTLDIDSENEVVLPGGADTTYIDHNRQVFVDHKYGTDTAVGWVRKMLRVPREGEQHAWQAHTGIYPKTGNRIGEDILVMAREVGIGASIGFLATDYGPPSQEDVKFLKSRSIGVPRSVVRQYKMLEYSLTAFPCNVACQGHAVAQCDTEKRIATIDDMVTKGRIGRWTAAMLGAPIASRRKMHAVTTPRRQVWVV